MVAPGAAGYRACRVCSVTYPTATARAHSRRSCRVKWVRSSGRSGCADHARGEHVVRVADHLRCVRPALAPPGCGEQRAERRGYPQQHRVVRAGRRAHRPADGGVAQCVAQRPDVVGHRPHLHAVAVHPLRASRWRRRVEYPGHHPDPVEDVQVPGERRPGRRGRTPHPPVRRPDEPGLHRHHGPHRHTPPPAKEEFGWSTVEGRAAAASMVWATRIAAFRRSKPASIRCRA